MLAAFKQAGMERRERGKMEKERRERVRKLFSGKGLNGFCMRSCSLLPMH